MDEFVRYILISYKRVFVFMYLFFCLFVFYTGLFNILPTLYITMKNRYHLNK